MTKPRGPRARAGDQGAGAIHGAASGAAHVGASGDVVEMVIPATSDYVRVVRLAITGIASRMPFSFNDIEDIKLAVAEACNNAILHARAFRAQGGGSGDDARVTISLRALPQALEIRVTDEGRLPADELQRLNLRKGKPTRAPVDELPERGFGLLLIRTVMDEVEHSTTPGGQTTIRMLKRVPASTPVAAPAKAEPPPKAAPSPKAVSPRKAAPKTPRSSKQSRA